MYQLKYTTLWEAAVFAAGKAGTALWQRIDVVETGLVDYRLTLADDEGDQDLLEAGLEVRREQLRQEMDLPELGDVDSIADLFVDLHIRSMDGEFVGQRVAGILYVQDVAALLDGEMADVMPAVEKLSAEKRLALNGMILWDWQEVAASREREFQRTGHHQLAVSDFGYWSCRACGQSGDDYTLPTDYPCVDEAPESTGFMYM